MIPQAAFRSSRRKHALLEDVRNCGPISTMWMANPFEADLAPISRDFALHPAYVALLPGVAGFGNTAGSRAFLEAALEAMPIGGDTGRLTKQILLLAWSHPEFGAARTLAEGPIRQACELAIDLVTKSLTTPQDRKAWRSVRSLLARAQAEAGGDSSESDVVMSMAWDLDEAPGAALDVILSWSSFALQAAHAQDSDIFSTTERENHMAATSRFHQEAMSELGELKPGDLAAYETYTALVSAKWLSDPNLRALNDRVVAQTARTRANEERWRQAVQNDALALTRAVPVLALDHNKS